MVAETSLMKCIGQPASASRIAKACLLCRARHNRHAFASLLLQNGESPVYVKDQLGHSTIKITVDIYGHLIPGANRQAVNRLPSLSSKPLEQAAQKADCG